MHRIIIFVLLLSIIPMVMAETIYTPYSKTECNNGGCSKEIFNEVTYINDNGVWYHKEYAYSLKDYYEINLTIDDEFPLTIVDYNYTTLVVEIDTVAQHWLKDINLKIWDKRNINDNSILLNETRSFIITTPRQEVIDLAELNLTIDDIYLKWGFNSTELTIESNASLFIRDCYIDQLFPANSDCTGDIDIQNYSSRNRFPMIAYNISDIPSNAKINDAILYIRDVSNDLDYPQSEQYDVRVHQVELGDTWYEGNPTWNTQPNYNATYMDNFIVDGNLNSFTWHNANITNGINLSVSNSYQDFSFFLIPIGQADGATENVGFSDESGTYPHYIVVNYTTTTPADTCTCPSVDSNWEIDLSDNCTLSSPCNLGTGNLSFINNGTFTCNDTLNISGNFDLATNQVIIAQSSCSIVNATG